MDPARTSSTTPPSRGRHAFQPPAWLIIAAVAAPALVVYALTLCPTVYVSGTGENITAAALLGVPHPPGFPLYCLLGRVAIVALPLAPAVTMNLFAAASMAVAAGILGWTVAGLTGRLVAGLLAGLLFAAARLPWSQAVIGEVYGLSALLFVIELALFLAWRGDLGFRLDSGRRPRVFCLFAFVYGIGVSVHPLHALMAPAYAVLWRTAPRRQARLLAAAAVVAALGFSLHLYAPLRSASNPPLDWGNPETWQAWWDYLTARQYRERMFSLPATAVLANAVRLGGLLVEQWTALGVALPLAGAWILRRRRTLAVGLLMMALADVLYAVNYDIPWEIEVYYLPLIILLGLAAGVAVGRWPRVAGGLAAAVCVLAVISNAPVAGRRGVDLIDRYGRDVLDALPENAVLVTPPTNPTFILLYLTQVEGARPDVDVYVSGKRGLTRLGEGAGEGGPPTMTLSRLALSGRPLYIAVREPLDELPGYRLEPAGVVYRVVRSDAPASALPWPPLRFDAATLEEREDFRLRVVASRYLLARSDHAWASGDSLQAVRDREQALALAGDQAVVHAGLALRHAEEGRPNQAIAAYQRATELGDDALLTNRLGRLHMQQGDVELAEASFRSAIAIDPELAIAHSNLGALLGSRGDFRGAAAALELAVELDPLLVKAYNNLGLALLKLGDRGGAERAWRRSLELNPEQPRIREQLARMSP